MQPIRLKGKDKKLLFTPPARIPQSRRGSVKGELLLPDSRHGVQRNPVVSVKVLQKGWGSGERERVSFSVACGGFGFGSGGTFRPPIEAMP